MESADALKRILNEVVVESKLHKVGEFFYQFEPKGATGVIVISESHISAHTWPEHKMIALDIFTCGKEGNAFAAYDLLLKKLKPKEAKTRVVRR